MGFQQQQQQQGLKRPHGNQEEDGGAGEQHAEAAALGAQVRAPEGESSGACPRAGEFSPEDVDGRQGEEDGGAQAGLVRASGRVLQEEGKQFEQLEERAALRSHGGAEAPAEGGGDVPGEGGGGGGGGPSGFGRRWGEDFAGHALGGGGSWQGQEVVPK